LATSAADKQDVMRSHDEQSRTDGNTKLPGFSNQCISDQTHTKKELAGSTLGITQIFSDSDLVIVTIFFLNHAPQDRRFQTYGEFVSLRDGFVRGYMECVAKKIIGQRK